MSRRPLRRGPVSAEVAHVIELMLQSANPEQVKSGLQRACEVFENGQAFTDPSFLRTGIAAHIRSTDVKVRRWTYKLVALLRDAQFLPDLETSLLGSETDPENRGWAAAAYGGIADERRRSQIIGKVDDYWGTSLELAAKLYARGQPAREELNLKIWESEPLARKWLCLLCGYAPASPRTIDARFANLDLARNAISDHDREVVEYSVWAEHHHPDGSYRGLLRRPDDLLDYPNVRRWLYRLLTKGNEAADAHRDLLLHGMIAANETSDVAREGLALGFANIYVEDIRLDTLEWFVAESSPSVKLALVDHLGLMANKYGVDLAREALIAEFGRQELGSVLRAKILSVSRDDWGIKRVVRQPALVDSNVSTADLFNAVPAERGMTLINHGEMKVIQVNQSGSNNTMTGVNAGEMYQSAIHALHEQKDQRFNDLTPLIEAFLKALEASNVDAAEKKLAIEATTAVAKAEGEEKVGRLAILKGVVRGLLPLPGMAAEAIEGGHKLVEAIQGML